MALVQVQASSYVSDGTITEAKVEVQAESTVNR